MLPAVCVICALIYGAVFSNVPFWRKRRTSSAVSFRWWISLWWYGRTVNSFMPSNMTDSTGTRPSLSRLMSFPRRSEFLLPAIAPMSGGGVFMGGGIPAPPGKSAWYGLHIHINGLRYRATKQASSVPLFGVAISTHRPRAEIRFLDKKSLIISPPILCPTKWIRS